MSGQEDKRDIEAINNEYRDSTSTWRFLWPQGLSLILVIFLFLQATSVLDVYKGQTVSRRAVSSQALDIASLVIFGSSSFCLTDFKFMEMSAFELFFAELVGLESFTAL